MNFRVLEFFSTVAELRSYSRAAMAHDVTQGAISQAMRQLEDDLGVKLLVTSRRPLVLTEAGELFLKGIQQLLRSYRRLEEDVREAGGGHANQLSIGAIYSIGSTYMPAAKQEFRTRHPDVNLRFEYASSEDVVAMVEDGTVEVGFISYARTTRKLKAIPWLNEPMRIICAPAHPLAKLGEIRLSQLNGCELIGFEKSLKVRTAVDEYLTTHNVTVDTTIEFDNIDSMVRAVEANVGVTIIPEATVRKEIADGSLRVVACNELKLFRPLAVVISRTGKLSRAADDFATMLLGRPLPNTKGPKPATQRDEATVSVIA